MTSTDPIFSVALGAMMVLAAMIAGVVLRRALRARHIQQHRIVERPDPRAAAAASADQQRRQRWKSIDLQAIHEVNRAEVSHLLERVATSGMDSLRETDRVFLDQFAPAPAPRRQTPPRDSSDYIGADLRHRPA